MTQRFSVHRVNPEREAESEQQRAYLLHTNDLLEQRFYYHGGNSSVVV